MADRRGRSGLERPAQQLEILGDLAVGGLQLLDPPHAVHHGGVVATAEPPPDLGQAARGELLGQVHRDLAGPREGAQTLGADQVATGGCCSGRETFRWISSIVILRSEARRMSARQSCASSSVISRPTSAPKAKSRMQRAFEHTHVGRDAVGEEFEHAVGDLQVAELVRILFDLLLQDAEAQLVVGGVQVDDQAGLQAADDPVLDAGDFGRARGRPR